MKIAPARLPGLLRDPAGIAAALVYGEDAGLVRERADALVHAVLGADPDPFRLAELADDAPKRIVEELTARALTGGRRVVRVRGAGAALVDPLERALKSGAEALAVLEAGALDRRNRLRLWAEAGAQVAAIACYPDEGAALTAVIRDGLAAEGVRADEEVLAFVASRLGADRAATRQELAKLALLVGPGGTLSLPLAREALGGEGTLALDGALAMALAGDARAADAALEQALADGASPVAILRGVIRALLRLDQAAALVAGGASVDRAIEAVRVFFRERPAFSRALQLWEPPQLASALEAAVAAERACKSTGSADVAIARELVLGLARPAGERRVRRG